MTGRFIVGYVVARLIVIPIVRTLISPYGVAVLAMIVAAFYLWGDD